MDKDMTIQLHCGLMISISVRVFNADIVCIPLVFKLRCKLCFHSNFQVGQLDKYFG